MDWDDLRFFLAVIRHKTLAAAAKHLNVTQSTVGRRIASLERRLGVRLVYRTVEGGGYVPTLAGEAIRAHVERVEAEMRSVQRAIGGLEAKLAGAVRIVCPATLASHLLAPCAAALYTRHPDIRLELISHPPTPPDVTAHDVDILVQFRRPEEGDIVVRRIGAAAFGLYASLAYLARHGEPDFGAACVGHHMVAMANDGELPALADWLAQVAGQAGVLLRADNRETLLWAALQGGGLALLPRFRGDAEPALQRLNPPSSPPSAEIWVCVHPEVRRLPRVRAVLDCVAETFRRVQGALDPSRADPDEHHTALEATPQSSRPL